MSFESVKDDATFLFFDTRVLLPAFLFLFNVEISLEETKDERNSRATALVLDFLF